MGEAALLPSRTPPPRPGGAPCLSEGYRPATQPRAGQLAPWRRSRAPLLQPKSSGGIGCRGEAPRHTHIQSPLHRPRPHAAHYLDLPFAETCLQQVISQSAWESVGVVICGDLVFMYLPCNLSPIASLGLNE